MAADVEHYTQRLSGSLEFAIERFGTRVAMVNLTAQEPRVLLAQHLAGEQPVLVYRVEDLERALAELQRREVEVAAKFEIPYGPGAELVLPGPQRIAIYQCTRPENRERLTGRRDF